MRALLDVNALIALLDEAHISHAAAMAWMSEFGAEGWASCPITQNGCIRIMSHAGYPNPQPIHAVIARLQLAASHPAHEFWPDDVSLLSEQHLTPTRIHSAGQLTDAYLLALAVAHGGRFVTFDRSVVRSAVPSASPAHLLTL